MNNPTTINPTAEAPMSDDPSPHHPSRPSGRITDEDSTAAGSAIYETALVAWDLRQPLTRDQAGLVEGRNTAIFQDLDSPGWLTAKFELPTGHSVTTTATTMSITTNHATGEPKTVHLDTKGLTLAEAAERMLGLADQLGIEQASVEAWQQDAALRVGGDRTVRRTKTLRGADVTGPFLAELTAATSLGEDRVTVTVSFRLDR